MPKRGGRTFDRLPLQVAQVLHDAQVWRSHQRNHRDTCAESALYALQESVDVLEDWLAEVDPDYRVGESMELTVARSPSQTEPEPPLPKPPHLYVVRDDDDEE